MTSQDTSKSGESSTNPLALSPKAESRPPEPPQRDIPAKKETRELTTDFGSTKAEAEGIKPPASAYLDVKGKPYILEKISLEPLYSQDMGGDKEGINRIKKDADSLDRLILGAIKKQKMSDSLNSYDEIYTRAMKTISLSDNTQSLVKLKRLLALFKANKPLRRMSYEELKEVLGR